MKRSRIDWRSQIEAPEAVWLLICKTCDHDFTVPFEEGQEQAPPTPCPACGSPETGPLEGPISAYGIARILG